MSIKRILYCIAAIILITSCSTQKTSDNNQQNEEMRDSALEMADNFLQDGKVVGTSGGITVSYFTGSPEFPDAKLEIVSPQKDAKLNADKVDFKFNVRNFELTKQTEFPGGCHCANSMQGQHIHNILNNSPYTAHYTDTFSKNLKEGHYINLSFLSRSYHESIKHPGAYVLNQFNVGKNSENVDLSGPLLFYSRPKGDYVGEETKNVLLDFYLVNTDLAGNGNKVRATINGNEFILTNWVPYMISGMGMGENTIKLELIDNVGNLIPGLYNQVERKINLKP